MTTLPGKNHWRYPRVRRRPLAVPLDKVDFGFFRKTSTKPCEAILQPDETANETMLGSSSRALTMLG
jgi:hypothetical protein